jgi:hypothetical protein
MSILSNGGLTSEVWVKGGGSSGTILGLAGEYGFEPAASGVKFVNGFADTTQMTQATLDRTQWHHLAGVLANPSMSGGGRRQT